jgi:hypothetical protein
VVTAYCWEVKQEELFLFYRTYFYTLLKFLLTLME